MVVVCLFIEFADANCFHFVYWKNCCKWHIFPIFAFISNKFWEFWKKKNFRVFYNKESCSLGKAITYTSMKQFVELMHPIRNIYVSCMKTIKIFGQMVNLDWPKMTTAHKSKFIPKCVLYYTSENSFTTPKLVC